MSGDTANFLAGGEFPIPVAQTSVGTGTIAPTITVEINQ
jgi:pilus assembly protein CpaC